VGVTVIVVVAAAPGATVCDTGAAATENPVSYRAATALVVA